MRKEIRESDKRWYEDKELNNWKLPPPANYFLRLPVIRHVRAAILIYRVERHYKNIPFGLRTGYDEWIIYAIVRGWC